MKGNPKVLELRDSLAHAWRMAYHLELEGGPHLKFFKELNAKINTMELSLSKKINHPDNEKQAEQIE